MAQRKQHNRVNGGALRTGGGAVAAGLRALEERAMVEEVVVVVGGGCLMMTGKENFEAENLFYATYLPPTIVGPYAAADYCAAVNHSVAIVHYCYC